MITTWRITKAKNATTAFDGEGARRAGGRWNSPGVAMIYTSESAALAALEMLVHIGKGGSLPAYVVIPCSFDESIVKHVDRVALPPGWRAYPAPPELQLIGNTWATTNETAVLRVPSAVIETEFNYLLNPNHLDFATIAPGLPQPFRFDLRLTL